MGLFDRINDSIRSALNDAENTDEALDYTYEQMKTQLHDVEQGISDLTTERKRLEKRRENLRDEVEKHNEQAREAVQQDRDDLARRALEKKKSKMSMIETLEDRVDELEGARQELINKRDELERRIQEFRTRKETLKARQKAADRVADASEGISGVGTGGAETDVAIDRAEGDVQDMEARAAALDELEDQGVIEDQLTGKDSLERELDQVETDRVVEDELDTLKREMDDGDEDEDEDE
jgi:phage shock protein A